MTDDAPAGTNIDAGTVATATLLLDRATRMPFAGATPSSDRTTGALPPAETKMGSGEMLAILGGAIERVALCFTPLAAAEIVAAVVAETAVVRIVNVPVSPPWAILIDEDTIAVALELVSVTTRPPDGALPVNQTVPVDVLPPVTEPGERVTFEMVAGLIVTGTEIATPA